MATPIALQLYTVRDELARDFEGTLERVARIGYDGVETAFFEPEIAPTYARQVIEGLGLRIASLHADLPLGERTDSVLALAADLGCDRLVWHGWPQDARYADAAGVGRLIAEYNAGMAVARDHGLRLGLHNHWWEFRDGVFDRLLDETDPDLFFEVDVYWAAVAGADPAALLQRLGPRAPLVHIKDGPGIPDAPKTAVGDGALPIREIVAASQADWLIVELDDCATDMLEAVARSHDFLRGVSDGAAKAAR